jgi:hypothetical protein
MNTVHRTHWNTQITPSHASISGVVLAIEKRPIPHPSGIDGMCIVIDSDGKDKWIEIEKCDQDFLRCAPSGIVLHQSIITHNAWLTFSSIHNQGLCALCIEYFCMGWESCTAHTNNTCFTNS